MKKLHPLCAAGRLHINRGNTGTNGTARGDRGGMAAGEEHPLLQEPALGY